MIIRRPLRRFPATARVGDFLRSEDGMMAPLMLICFFLMILLGGIAVDVMRFEQKRVAVQNTLDRATLAAASLEQTLQPEDVVIDYFAKGGLDQDLDAVQVDEGLNYRVVTASATAQSRNYFMSMLDIPELVAISGSRAEQRVTNVEIALVLDVSGSMYNEYSRIINLKIAAKEFIDTVLDNDTENKISISIVPYNGQVNLGPHIFGQFSTRDHHAYPDTYCLDLPETLYGQVPLSLATTYPQSPFADTFSSTSRSSGYVAPDKHQYDASRGLYSNVWCQPVPENYVRLHSNDRLQLKQAIDDLVAIGGTSIDLGMKWGAAFLDPAAQPIVANLATSGQVPTYFDNRPAAYDDIETMKVIVLMTDGENFPAEQMNDGYRAGVSPIWKSNDRNGNFSIFHASKVDNRNSTTICNSKPYWVPHLGEWKAEPWNGSSGGYGGRGGGSSCYSPTASHSGVTHLNWEEVWPQVRMQWVAWQLYARALGNNATRTNVFNQWVSKFRTLTPETAMDQRLKTICKAAKDEGILVYGIAFETTQIGKNAIRSCVSQPESTYYFDVQGLNIRTAFALIASNLSQLRLMQ